MPKMLVGPPTEWHQLPFWSHLLVPLSAHTGLSLQPQGPASGLLECFAPDILRLALCSDVMVSVRSSPRALFKTSSLEHRVTFLCFSFPSCMGYCSSWVTADTSFIQHTSVAHGVCDRDSAKSWWHRNKQDYLPLEEGKAFWDFFLFEVYTFFFEVW